ncbi:hypothetical protein A0J61_05971 [Choanephora cucurbitarum]|uniref:Inhibitor I9 domain-containing protein n=1 Tax=Choanephora cucurbitarum TaxID=101091 RepID=A0A1C7NA30_9FUNG|nr:hypothetical protein A0J61_05971 [Choanephora cucurbitarum]
MRSILLFCLTVLLATIVYAAEEGYTDYLIALSEPVTDAKWEQARADIEKIGGKVNYEITLGMKGLAVSVPSNIVLALDQKDYIDFMEQDHTVHAFDN